MKKNENKICIVGAGGFGKEVLCCLIDSLKERSSNLKEMVCFMVDDKYYDEKEVLGIEVIPMSIFNPANLQVVVAIGNPILRKNVVESLPKETKYITIIHPSAVISKWVEIGEGSVITAGTILTCDIKIGRHAHLNLQSTVGHDCIIGDYFTSAPATNISGKCQFGNCVYLGSNSSVREGIKITDNVTVGMGGVVVKDINEEGVYVGTPVKKLIK